MDRAVRNSEPALGRDPTESIEDAYRAELPDKYFDDVWNIRHVDTDEIVRVDFRSRFGDLRGWQQLVAKNIVFLRCDDRSAGFSTVQSPRTMLRLYANIASIFYFMNNRFGGRSLCSLSDRELIELVIHNIDGSVASSNTVYGRVRLIILLYDLRFAEHRFVPEKFLPVHNLSGLWEGLCAVWVREAGQSYADWRAGGSFDIVPFEISLAILAYCRQLIKSDETKYLLAWFQAERKLCKQGALPDWKVARKVFSMFGERSSSYSSQGRAANVDEVYFRELCSFYPEVSSRDQLPLKGVPFLIGKHSNRDSLTRKADHLLTACFVSLLILTGIRHGEASGMAHDAFRQNGASYLFASSIDKTNHGVTTDRHVSSVVAEFIGVLDGLGSFGLDDDRRKDLFSYARCNYNNATNKLYSLGKNAINVRMQIISFYEIFLEGQGDDVRDLCPHVTAHGFRHAWAEFAMRRFDGNIMPLIRDHYRHHFGSKMTGVYTHNKIELSDYQNLGKRQIFELVSRYLDGAATLHGLLGEFLTRQADNISLIEMHDKNARDDAIVQMIDEHICAPIVTPHEYGLCILTENTKQLANCRDEAGIPKTQTADVDSCAGCVNSCMVKQKDGKEDTHFLTLKRLLATYLAEATEWQDNALIGPLFVDGAQKTRRALEALVGKMEAENV